MNLKRVYVVSVSKEEWEYFLEVEPKIALLWSEKRKSFLGRIFLGITLTL